MSDLSVLDKLLIQHICQEQIIRFAALNDAGAHRELADMFVEAGSFARPSQPDEPVIGREAIHAAFCARPKRKSVHLVSNVVVDVISATQANARSRIVLFASPSTEGFAHPPHLIGSFIDQLVMENGQWLFVSRLGSIDIKFD